MGVTAGHIPGSDADNTDSTGIRVGGSDASSSNPLPIKLTDGTNPVSVKAASTAPGATDPALVVALSPNGAQATAANQSTIITSIQILDDVPTAANGAFSKGNPIMGQMDDTSTVDATENNCSAVRITSKRALHTNLRDDSGNQFGTVTNPIYVGDSGDISPLPDFTARANKVIAAGTTYLSTYTMTANIAILDFHFGGRGPGQASLLRIDTSVEQTVPNGNFNSSGDVSAWANAGIGSSAGLTWAYTTAQAHEGTGSAIVTFTQSDQNNYPAIKYTWGSAQDFSAWRYISAWARVTVASGGAQSRAIQIILTDSNAATRTYQTAGTTVTAPFSTEQWVQVLGDIANPFSETGTFDVYNVSSITLKLLDGGNKTGSIYWDEVEFQQSQTIVERIYIDANRTFQLIVKPSELFDNGEILGLQIKNNDTVSREFTATAKGVER